MTLDELSSAEWMASDVIDTDPEYQPYTALPAATARLAIRTHHRVHRIPRMRSRPSISAGILLRFQMSAAKCALQGHHHAERDEPYAEQNERERGDDRLLDRIHEITRS